MGTGSGEEVVQAGDETVEGGGGLADFVVVVRGQPAGQVGFAGGDLGQRVAQLGQAAKQPAQRVGGQGDAEAGAGEAGQPLLKQQSAQRCQHCGLVDDAGQHPVRAGNRGCGEIAGAPVERQLAHGGVVAGLRQPLRGEAGDDFADRAQAGIALRVGDDAAVAGGEKGIAATQPHVADAGADFAKQDVAGGDADDAAVAADRAGDGDPELLRAGEEIGRGDAGFLALVGQPVPRAGGRIVAGRRAFGGEVVMHLPVGEAGKGLVEEAGQLRQLQAGRQFVAGAEADGQGFDRRPALTQPLPERLAVAGDAGLQLLFDTVADFVVQALVGEQRLDRDDAANQGSDAEQQAGFERHGEGSGGVFRVLRRGPCTGGRGAFSIACRVPAEVAVRMFLSD